MKRTLFAWTVSALLAACGGEDSGTFSLALTDAHAPVDEAFQVVIGVSGVTLHGSAGQQVFAFDPPRRVDLMQLQDGVRETLLDHVEVPPGRYQWLRLELDMDAGNRPGFMTRPSGMYPIEIPSGYQTGLKFVGVFDVVPGSDASFTVDFDVRKSVVCPAGQPACLMKPVLRMVDDHQAGSVTGTVDAALLQSPSCAGGNAVYLFEGHGGVPTDVIDRSGPVTSGVVQLDPMGRYQYHLALVPAGDYTVALTCDAMNDDPETDDTVIFTRAVDVVIQAGQRTRRDF